MTHRRPPHLTAECYTASARLFVPDHLHALVCCTSENCDSMEFNRTFRRSTAYHYRRAHDVRLWQDGFYDRVLRDAEATFDVVSYIVANPVRAGLVETVTDYPFAGSSRFSLDEIASEVQWRPDEFG